MSQGSRWPGPETVAEKCSYLKRVRMEFGFSLVFQKESTPSSTVTFLKSLLRLLPASLACAPW